MVNQDKSGVAYFLYCINLFLRLNPFNWYQSTRCVDWKSVLNFPEKMEDMKIEKFISKNYSLWKVQMHSLLVKQDLALAIEGNAKKPSTMSNEDWQKMDEKAMASIFLSLAKDVLFNVSNKKSTKKVWDKLQNMYQTTSTANKIFIMKKLFNLEGL